MKISIKYQVLCIMGILLFVLPLILNTFPISPAFAAESTPSADPLRQSDSEASIKSKLEELKKQIASKAAKLKQEVNRKLKDKAYVGKIKSKSDTSLTLATNSGPKIVSLNQDTIWESEIKSKTKFSSKTISLEDYVATLGDTDETEVLIAKKVILLPAPKAEQKTYQWGKIISISDKLTTLKTDGLKNIAAVLPVNPKAKINDFVILTGTKDNNEIFEAEFVYIIPQGAVLKPKIATKSATPKPTSR